MQNLESSQGWAADAAVGCGGSDDGCSLFHPGMATLLSLLFPPGLSCTAEKPGHLVTL